MKTITKAINFSKAMTSNKLKANLKIFSNKTLTDLKSFMMNQSTSTICGLKRRKMRMSKH